MIAADRALELAWQDEPPADWDEWADRAQGASFAARTGFLLALAEFPGAGHTRFLTASRGGERCGAVPVFVSRRWGRLWARSLPFGTYGGPLLAPAVVDPESVSGALAAEFGRWVREARVAGGEIVHGPGAGAAAPAAAWSALAQATTRARTHLVPLEPGIEPLRSRLRRETRKGFRKAQREGVRIEEDAAALPAVYALYRAQATRWSVRRPYPLAFAERILAHPSGFARLLVARREGEILAGVLCLSGGGECFLWWSGSAQASRAALAFPLLLWSGIERAAARGERRVNLGASAGRAGIERFKESLGAVPAAIWIHHLRPGGFDPAARLVQWARAVVRRS